MFVIEIELWMEPVWGGSCKLGYKSEAGPLVVRRGGASGLRFHCVSFYPGENRSTSVPCSSFGFSSLFF